MYSLGANLHTPSLSLFGCSTDFVFYLKLESADFSEKL